MKTAIRTAACCAALAAASILAPGCVTDPATGEVTIRVPAAAVDFATNAIREYLESRATTAEGAADAETDAGESLGSTEAAPSSAPAAASAALDFRFGGFKGGKAAEDPRCRISGLKVGSDSLSIKWETGIPVDWKRETLEKGPMIVAAVFYREGDKWVGGKFDWIDEHRSSRSLENVHAGYGGWNAAAWRAARRHAFCVVSADGKYRSNLLED
jgi:hypothetical protein